MTVIATKMKKKAPIVGNLLFGVFFFGFWLLLCVAALGEGGSTAFFIILLGSLIFLPCVAVCIYQVVSWCALPDVLAQYDNDYLYVFGRKERKIPLSLLKNVNARTRNGWMLKRDVLVCAPCFVFHLFVFLSDKTLVKIRCIDQPHEAQRRLETLIENINKYPKYKDV